MSDSLVSVFMAFLILQILLDLGLFGLFVAVCARNRALEEQLDAEKRRREAWWSGGDLDLGQK
ncbi:MAG: hypothetical protein MUF87_09025 [Anaerolineae bacterium]|jgi:hypothetical protein|nr:hypothetical protein [Anaerolineae bacterium]